jgi:hypothetical protein
MNNLRTQLDLAKQSHLATRYPGDLALEILAPKRHLKFVWWIAPLAAAAVVAVVLWSSRQTSTAPATDIPANQVATVDSTNTSDDSLFALQEVPNMQTDMGIAPSSDESSMPSFTEITVPEMPSFDSTTSSTESST